MRNLSDSQRHTLKMSGQGASGSKDARFKPKISEAERRSIATKRVTGIINGKDRLSPGPSGKPESRDVERKAISKKDIKTAPITREILEDEPAAEKDKNEILKLVSETSTEGLQAIIREGGAGMEEGLADNGDDGVQFLPGVPKASFEPPPVVKAQPAAWNPVGEIWYPHRGDGSVQDENTTVYLNILKEGAQSDIDVFTCLRTAREVLHSIECDKSDRIWVTLDSLIPQLQSRGLTDIACDICQILKFNPENIHPYIKGVKRLVLLISHTSEKVKTLEEKISRLTEIVSTLIVEGQAHQEESLKFAAQMSNVSANMSNMQEIFDQTIIKVSKLDVLPASIPEISSAVSVPSTPQPGELAKRDLISLKESGEYIGEYSIKVSNGKVVGVTPPTNATFLSEIISLAPNIQEIFINLDQVKIVNKVMANPQYKEAFVGINQKLRGTYMRELCKGLLQKRFQWSKVL